MSQYDALLQEIGQYKNEGLYQKAHYPISLRSDRKLYFIKIEEDGTVIIFDRYAHLRSAMYNTVNQTPDEQAALNGYLLFIDKLPLSMYHGFNKNHQLTDKYKDMDVSAVKMTEGADPRFVLEGEARRLVGIVHQLNECLGVIATSWSTPVNETQYYRYSETIKQVFVDTFYKELPHQRIQTSMKQESKHLLDSKSKQGTWFVSCTYLPHHLKGSDGFAIQILIYDPESEKILGNTVLPYESQSYIYRAFITLASRQEYLPERIVVADYKTISYIMDFISAYSIDYAVDYLPFFRQCYEYYKELEAQAEVLEL